MILNEKAFEQAKSLINAGKVVRESDWIDAQISSVTKGKQLQDSDWEEYTGWFLGIDPEKAEHYPLHYLYKYGDFEAVHRSGLLNAQKKAERARHYDILNAINQLIAQIDEEPDVVTEASEESFPASDPPNWRSRR